jgi:hypothetical protein
MGSTFSTTERATADRMGQRPRKRQPRELGSIPLDTASPKIRKAAAEVLDLTAKMTAAMAALREAEASLPTAQRADAEAEAAAVRANKPVRVTAAEDQALEMLELRRREHAALEIAVDSAVRDLERLVLEDRDRWLGVVGEKLAADVTAARSTLEAFEAGLGAISEDLALRRWIGSFPSSKTFRPVSLMVGAERASDTVAALAAALEEIVRPERETFLREPADVDDDLEAAEA